MQDIHLFNIFFPFFLLGISPPPSPLPHPIHCLLCSSQVEQFLITKKNCAVHTSLIMNMLLYSEYWLFSSPTCFSRFLRIILSFFFSTSALIFLPMPRLMRYLLFLCFHSLMPLFIDSLVHSLTNICNSLSYAQLREHLVSQISFALLSIALINYYLNWLLVLGKRPLVVNSLE